MLKTRIILSQEELESIITKCNGNLALLECIQEYPVETIEELKSKLIKKNYVGLDLFYTVDASGNLIYPYLCDIIKEINPSKYETIYLEEILEILEDENNKYSQEFINGVKRDLILSEFGSIEYIY